MCMFCLSKVLVILFFCLLIDSSEYWRPEVGRVRSHETGRSHKVARSGRSRLHPTDSASLRSRHHVSRLEPVNYTLLSFYFYLVLTLFYCFFFQEII